MGRKPAKGDLGGAKQDTSPQPCVSRANCSWGPGDSVSPQISLGFWERPRTLTPRGCPQVLAASSLFIVCTGLWNLNPRLTQL